MYFAFKIGSLVKKFGCRNPKNSYNRLAEAEDTKTLQPRRGYVALYVGKEAKRYEVPIKYLSSPTVQRLLIRSQEDDDLDTEIDGPIMIAACTPEMFERLLEDTKHH